MLHQSLVQAQQQRMQQILAPQMRQSLEFLQVPILELRALIQKEMELNPVLEEKTPDNKPLEIEPAMNGPDNREELDFKEEYEKLARLDDEWREYFHQAGSMRPHTPEDEEKHQFFMESLTQSETLQEHLLRQLGLTDLREQDYALATMLIGSINEDGYLNVTLGELAETAGHPLADLERVLRAVQDMDPVGVGARDLTECLLLQIERMGVAESNAARIIRDHLEPLAARRYADIGKALGLTLEQVRAAAAFIATLEPRPGRLVHADTTAYVVPEVSVQKVGDEYTVSMNKEHLPHVRISKHYRQLIESPDTPEETKSYIRDKIRAGVFMIKSIEQRQQTIRNIAVEIVAVQRDFFEHGVSHLRPLVMSAISEKLGIHETTVSRAIAGKYMQTPRGVFELKYFFNPGYRTAGGESVSNKTIKDVIQQLVDEEDFSAPLSDQAITEQLKARGLKVARRTIAKYREELKILPSHLRKG